MKNKLTLGKLEKVNIREVWKNEARDFTNWLAEEDHLTLLGDELGLQINLITTEANIGAFSADILAEDEVTGAKIIIENQLEQTDHDHLGKLITYGSGFDAKYLIWIFSDIREEHRKAIDWLNERLVNEYPSIFAVKIEVWKIGDSMPAPKFQVICEPNEWAKNVKHSADNLKLSERNLLQLDFWEAFNKYLSDKKTKVRVKKAAARRYYNVYTYDPYFEIGCVVGFGKKFIRCEIWIRDNKSLFHHLLSEKDSLKKDLGFELEWKNSENAKSSVVFIQKNDITLNNQEDFVKCFKWFVEITEKYIDVIPKYCQ